MSFENPNSENDGPGLEIMGYLIEKLESRYNSIIKLNQLINTTNTPAEFFSFKNDFKLLFNDLEEDFKQAIFSIKALTTQNENILNELKIKNKENKNILDQLNKSISENKNLKIQMEKFENDSNNFNVKKEESKRGRGNYDRYEIDTDPKNRNYKTENNRNNNKREKEGFNDYEIGQLSNVKNIMDNMKKNKMKLKIAIEQHFTNNNQENI